MTVVEGAQVEVWIWHNSLMLFLGQHEKMWALPVLGVLYCSLQDEQNEQLDGL